MHHTASLEMWYHTRNHRVHGTCISLTPSLPAPMSRSVAHLKEIQIKERAGKLKKALTQTPTPTSNTCTPRAGAYWWQAVGWGSLANPHEADSPLLHAGKVACTSRVRGPAPSKISPAQCSESPKLPWHKDKQNSPRRDGATCIIKRDQAHTLWMSGCLPLFISKAMCQTSSLTQQK